MDTKLLFRVHRKSTDSWLSLVVPDELSSKEQKAIWIEDMCGEHFQPKQIQSIPKDLIDEGFEVKSYAINNIETVNGLYIILFVLQLKPARIRLRDTPNCGVHGK